MLEAGKAESQSRRLFSEDGSRPIFNSSGDYLHRELRETLRMAPDYVLHLLRHTYGKRLGKGGADAFSIMRLMGQSSVTISQRHVHPTPEALDRAVERLEALNQRAIAALPESHAPALPGAAEAAETCQHATVFATVP